MPEQAARSEYLVLSRGQWDRDKSPEEIQQAIDAFYTWHDQLVQEGKMKAGQRLAIPAKLVSRRGVTDGPFAEAKEVIGGYAIMEFDTKEEAVASAVEFMTLHAEYGDGWEGECEMRQLVP
jgi:hypothetical protein